MRVARRSAPKIAWPEGRSFAFSIFDDTDWTTLENGPLIYDLLTSLGFRITKSVWPLAVTGHRTTGGSTCAEQDYLDWVLTLQNSGHEIGYHNATDHPSLRDETELALDTFRQMFGHYPRVGADHAGNKEALYAGPRRLSGTRSLIYALAERTLQPKRPRFSGEDPDSPYFWGDICQRHISYWRNFSFADVNTLNACPEMPYHDPSKPFVNHYFASSDAPRCDSFVQLLSSQNLDRLEAEGGSSIIYTHFGVDFVVNGELDPRFIEVMTDLARRDGWFVPVSELLDFLREQQPSQPITKHTRRQLEQRWIIDRIKSSEKFGPSVVTTEASR